MTAHKKTYLALLFSLFVGFSSFLSIMLIPGCEENSKIIFLILLPCLCVSLLICSIKSAKSLPRIPRVNLSFIVGLLIILGGSLFDIGITLIKSPDLALEDNVFVTTMFSLGYSLGYVKLYNLMIQILLVSTMVSFLWLSARSFDEISRSITKKNILKIIPEVYCGKGKGYRDLFLSLNAEPLYLNASAAPIFIGVCLYRIYCGLEWLEIVPISRMYAPIGFMLGASMMYVWMIHKRLK